MFEKDSEIKTFALNMWANYIETSDIHLSAVDAKQMKQSFNSLTTEQMEFVVRLRKLAAKELEENNENRY